MKWNDIKPISQLFVLRNRKGVYRSRNAVLSWVAAHRGKFVHLNQGRPYLIMSDADHNHRIQLRSRAHLLRLLSIFRLSIRRLFQHLFVNNGKGQLTIQLIEELSINGVLHHLPNLLNQLKVYLRTKVSSIELGLFSIG